MRTDAGRAGILRLTLAGLLVLQPIAQAAELAPVDILLTRAIPQDEAAIAAAGSEKGVRLAILQSDLALVVEGLEGFASEADAAPSLKRLQESVDVPEQFKDRAAALDAAYRALAVVDYSWAKRLPEAPCSPDASRAALLKSGALSSWISSLLGVEGDAAAALDRASAATKASAREYALLRAKVRRLSEALGSEKAVGAMRASLYCRRAEAYEALSAANRTSGLTAASRATGDDEVAGVYVLARPGTDGWEILGAATSIDGAIVTDARLADSEGLALLGRDGKKSIAVTVERRDSGLALLRASEPIKGFVLADAAPAKDDLIEALGHPERTGVWTRTRGLVTSADELSFQSDAVVDVGMAGGAALTEDGKLAGMFVLRRARAGAEAFDWPVGVSAPALKSWLAGGTLTAASGSVEVTEAGTASILTASRPMGVTTPAGAEATQVSHHVFYQDGIRAVCMANCDDPAPAPAPRARSRTRYTNPRSSYGSSNANAELGKALGEAVAPLVEAMIFKGIPALFRGIGSLFSRKPKAAPVLEDNRRHSATPAPQPPPNPLKPASMKLSVSRTILAQGETLEAVATVTFTGTEGTRAGRGVSFTVVPGDKLNCGRGETDASGVARTTCTAVDNVRDRAFDSLENETRRRLGMGTSGRVRRKPAKGDKIGALKERVIDAGERLDEEADKHPDRGDDTPGLYKPIPETEEMEIEIKGDRVRLGASLEGLEDTTKVDVMERPCIGGGLPVPFDDERPSGAARKYRCPHKRLAGIGNNAGGAHYEGEPEKNEEEDAVDSIKPLGESKPESPPPDNGGKKKLGRKDLPVRGEPNSSDSRDDGNGNGQIRDYDSEGRAKKDHDFGHDHGQGDPHMHDWDWTDPAKPIRGPARPLKPGE